MRRRYKTFLRERNQFSASGTETLLSVSEYYGVKPRAEAFVGEEHESRAASLEGYRIVRKGDLVMNYMLAWKGAYGASDHDGIVSPAYAVFEVDQSIANLRFLHHRTRSDHTKTAFRSRSKGIIESRLRLYPYSFLAMDLDLPDLPTQKAIADFLDRETARIDQLIEKKRRFINLANERWVSELNDAVFPTFSNWSHLPGEWKKVRLKYLTDPMRPIMYGIVLPGPNVEFGKLIVKGGDVKPGRLDPELLCKTTIEIESSYVRSRVKAGDLIISIRGGIGDLEVVPKTIEGANLTQDAARIAPRSGIDVEWLRYALSAPVVFHLLEAKSLGAAVRGINIFDLKRVFVPTPPFETQTRIRDGLVAAERRLARLKERVVQHTEKIQEFRSALITASVTGQIDVSTWSKQGMTDRRFDQIEEATSA